MVIAYTPGRDPIQGSQSSAGLARTDNPAPFTSAAKTFLRVPFDAMREQYASAVRAGLVECSLLASARFERKLGELERVALGPWARGL